MIYRLFSAMPVDVRHSDIIPLVEVLARRFLHGEAVYQPVNDFGYTIAPNYLPMHWLPYCVPMLLKIDVRWAAMAVHAIAATWLVRRSSKFSGEPVSILVPLLLVLNWLII